jgi:cell division ATPase FtsA
MATIVPTREALVFDIGATGTDCYLIRDDVLVEVGRSFMGGQFFSRTLSRIFKSDVQTAETLKLAFSSAGVLSEKDRNLVQQGLQKPLERWAAMMAETLINVAGREPLPGNVFFAGGGAMLPGLRKYLLAGFRQAELNFERTPEFVNLGEKPLNGFAYAPTGFRGMLFALVLSLGKTI